MLSRSFLSFPVNRSCHRVSVFLLRIRGWGCCWGRNLPRYLVPKPLPYTFYTKVFCVFLQFDQNLLGRIQWDRTFQLIHFMALKWNGFLNCETWGQKLCLILDCPPISQQHLANGWHRVTTYQFIFPKIPQGLRTMRQSVQRLFKC